MRSQVRFIAAFTLLSCGVFVLPYLVKPTSTILSASFLSGFNNSLAYTWYAMALFGAGYFLSAGMSNSAVRQSFEPSRPLFTPPPTPVIAIMIAHVALFSALYVKTHGFTFGEPLYFQDAAYRATKGAVPYVDFYFFYGPLMISPVVALTRFVGLFPAYAIYYVATYVAGLYLLYVVSSVFTGQRNRILWYALFAIGFFNPITGLNYTFVRFTLPIVTLLATWQCYQRVTMRRWFTAVVLFVLAVLCSPDVAIVTVASIGVLGIVLLWVETPSRMLSARGAALAGIPLLALTLASAAMLLIDGTLEPVAAYLTPVVTFAAGGWSTPIDPSLPMLSLLTASLLAAALLWSAWREHRAEPVSAPLAAYAVLLLLMQRASFGKSDVEHIAFSGLPAFLAVLWISPHAARGRAQRWIAALLVVGVVVSLQFYHAMLFVPSLVQKWSQPAASAPATLGQARPATKSDIQASLEKAVQQFGVDRVFYMHRLEYFRLPIYLRHDLKPFMYQPTLASAFTNQDIEDVIASLRRTDVVVLARRADLAVTTPIPPLPTHWWFYATSSPLPGSQIFNLTLEFQARLEAPLVSFLNSEYDVAFEDGEIVGLVRRRRAAAPVLHRAGEG